MSFGVKNRLTILQIITTHEERVGIDAEIERRTGKNCDEGIGSVSDDELIEIVAMVLRRKKRKPMEAVM